MAIGTPGQGQGLGQYALIAIIVVLGILLAMGKLKIG